MESQLARKFDNFIKLGSLKPAQELLKTSGAAMLGNQPFSQCKKASRGVLDVRGAVKKLLWSFFYMELW